MGDALAAIDVVDICPTSPCSTQSYRWSTASCSAHTPGSSRWVSRRGFVFPFPFFCSFVPFVFFPLSLFPLSPFAPFVALLALASCIFSFSVLGLRETRRARPQPLGPGRPVPGVCPFARLLLGGMKSTCRGSGWPGDQGVCDPFQKQQIMTIVVCLGACPNPERTLAVSPVLGSIPVFCFWLVVEPHLGLCLLGPLRFGRFGVGPKVLHLVLSDGVGRLKVVLGVVWSVFFSGKATRDAAPFFS